MKKTVTLAVAVLFLSNMVLSCASSPEKIQATYVSPYQYESWSCERITDEIKRVESQLSQIEAAQKKKATTDAVGMAVGMVVFWPALLLLAAGDDQKQELSRLKGEHEALQTIYQEKCIDKKPREIEVKQKSL